MSNQSHPGPSAHLTSERGLKHGHTPSFTPSQAPSQRRDRRWLSAAVVLAASFAGVALAACNREAPAPSVSTATEPSPPVAGKAAVYQCPMHPSVTSDKPGKCPECGMNLVLVGSPSAAHDHH